MNITADFLGLRMQVVHTVAIVIAIAAVLSTGAASAQDFVVIAAKNAGKTYRPGTALRVGQNISLPSGARITILHRSGKVLKLSGPLSRTLSSGDGAGSSGDLSAVTNLLRTQSDTLASSRETGGALSGGRATAPADYWTIDVRRSGRACAQRGRATFWRFSTDRMTVVAIWPPGGAEIKLRWPSGRQLLDLPRAYIVTDTEFYVGSKDTSQLTLSVLPDDIRIEDDGKVLNWMAEQNCHSQALRLIDKLADQD